MKKKTQSVKTKRTPTRKVKQVSSEKNDRALWIAVYFMLGGTFIVTSIYLIRRYLESDWTIPSGEPVPQDFILMFFWISFQLIFAIALLAIANRMIRTGIIEIEYWGNFYKNIAIKIMKILFR